MLKSKNKYINFIKWRVADIRNFIDAWRFRLQTEKRYQANLSQIPHSITGELIVSLTSHPMRFSFAELTIKALLTQTVKPDRVIFWVTAKDQEMIPESILAMRQRGLEIRGYEKNIGPYTKLVPTLELFPDAHVVTADDDVYYPPNWLSMLIKEWDGSAQHIVANWGTYLFLNENNTPVSAIYWCENPDLIQSDKKYFMPWGESGVFYPAGCFNSDVTDNEKFTRLSPNADDYWFFWMGRLNGSRSTQTCNGWRRINWPGSQKFGLWKASDLWKANDIRVHNLVQAYGFPL